MFYEMKNESDRLPVCEKYVRAVIKELDYQIAQCDYSEDVNGNPVYEPGAYSYEKREFLNQKSQWETLLNMLTQSTPYAFYAN